MKVRATNYQVNNNQQTMKGHKRSSVNGPFGSDRSRQLAIGALFGFVSGALIMSAITGPVGRWPSSSLASGSATTPIQLEAILHYATSRVVPQQTRSEIKQSFDVLRSLGPCNFLVFGLGYDSLMWAALNPNGTTLFLEESDEWVKTVLKDAPFLNAKTVSYKTQLKEADTLLKTYLDEPDCRPERAFVRGNKHCKLALDNLPNEVYNTEWDVIMIDAPRGYQQHHPGRMAAIFSAAVMARERTGPGNTHVYLHDVERKVEESFAKEFLCMKNKVGGAGKLWHFEIPPSKDFIKNDGDTITFC